jgi:long-chain fatty acid transport protein
MKLKSKILVSMMVAGGMISPLAHATNGYFRIGVGDKYESMGGAGIALPQDSLAAGTNPAGMAMVGDRMDIGLTWFKPNRSETTTGSPMLPANGTYSGNGQSNFFIPDFGYNKMIKPDMSLGITVYGAGGMNTNYATNPFLGSGPAGVNLSQLFIAPTWAMKVTPTQSVGASLVAVYQMFSAYGLQAFQGTNPFSLAPFSTDPAHLTNNGTDTSTGVGVRLGWTGQVSDMVTLGATYQPKISMSKFSKYAGLFADQGKFDIPGNYGVGAAVKANDATTVALDVTRILYSGVNSVGDSSLVPLQFGATGGPGFGWKDMTVVKLGVKYKLNPGLTLRAGFNHNNQQIGTSDAWINILAPGVVQNHLTLGATWALANQSELTVGYVHAFEQTVTGPNPFGGTISIKMHEDSIGVTYGW